MANPEYGYMTDLTHIEDEAESTSSGHNKGWFATPAELREAYPTAEAGDHAIVGTTDTIWIWSTVDNDWVDTAEKGIVTSVNEMTGDVTLRTYDVGVTEMPAASATYEGKILQYLGETTADFYQGCFYLCEKQNSTYTWVYLPITEGAVHIEGDETITGDKNFTGQVTKDGNKLISVDDYASMYVAGVGKVDPENYGVGLDSTSKNFYLRAATAAEVAQKASNTKPLTPATLNAAVHTVFLTMTQTEYDALETKDANTYYMITEE